jgi:hypothetical protein
MYQQEEFYPRDALLFDSFSNTSLTNILLATQLVREGENPAAELNHLIDTLLYSKNTNHDNNQSQTSQAPPQPPPPPPTRDEAAVTKEEQPSDSDLGTIIFNSTSLLRALRESLTEGLAKYRLAKRMSDHVGEGARTKLSKIVDAARDWVNHAEICFSEVMNQNVLSTANLDGANSLTNGCRVIRHVIEYADSLTKGNTRNHLVFEAIPYSIMMNTRNSAKQDRKQTYRYVLRLLSPSNVAITAVVSSRFSLWNAEGTELEGTDPTVVRCEVSDEGLLLVDLHVKRGTNGKMATAKCCAVLEMRDLEGNTTFVSECESSESPPMIYTTHNMQTGPSISLVTTTRAFGGSDRCTWPAFANAYHSILSEVMKMKNALKQQKGPARPQKNASDAGDYARIVTAEELEWIHTTLNEGKWEVERQRATEYLVEQSTTYKSILFNKHLVSLFAKGYFFPFITKDAAEEILLAVQRVGVAMFRSLRDGTVGVVISYTVTDKHGCLRVDHRRIPEQNYAACGVANYVSEKLQIDFVANYNLVVPIKSQSNLSLFVSLDDVFRRRASDFVNLVQWETFCATTCTEIRQPEKKQKIESGHREVLRDL